MTRYVAFLRGINVSGQKLIKMEELKKHFMMPGLQNIVTYIQSGNVLFDSEEKKAELLRSNIEQQLAKQLGYAVPAILRSLPEIKKVIKNNPFDTPVAGEKVKLYVYFLSAVPAPGLKDTLEAFSNELEQVKVMVMGREVYLLTGSYGSTRFPNTFIEKKLGVQSTARNWNTVNKIMEL